MHTRSRAPAAALAVFVVVTCIAAAVLFATRDRHLGTHEDHFDKGVSLYETGSMSSGAKPMVFRPPGYPVFVAAALALRGAALTVTGNTVPPSGRLITALAAQAVLLGVLAAAIVWHLRGRTNIFVAVACALAVACNPLLLVIAGFVSYPLLHIVVITIATLMLLRHVGAGAPAPGAMFANGLVWGVATLVKSVTLVAPAFILLWAWLHYGRQAAVRATALFTAGLLLVVAPYTARNYAVTGRFIPVNAQAAFALWATSLERIPPGANYQHWVKTWFASAMPTYTAVTGVTDYSLPIFEDHVLELDDRFGMMAADNLRREPMVYAYNASHNSVMFLVDPPTSYWFGDYHFGWSQVQTARMVATLAFGLMMAVAFLAIIVGCVRCDPRWTLAAALFVMMWASHALTFLEARYLYVKVPTIVVGFVLACTAMASGDRSQWRTGAAGIAALTAVLSLLGLFAL